MTKHELMENYTMEQLADKIIALEIAIADIKNAEKIIKQYNSVQRDCKEFIEEQRILTEKINALIYETTEELKEKLDRKQEEIDQIDDILNELFGVKHDIVSKPDEFKKILKEKIGTTEEDVKRLESEYAESLEKLVKRQEKIESLEKRTIADFLPKEPIKVADILISAEGEADPLVLGNTVYKETYKVFDVSGLRQIAEHLLTYCNANKEEVNE